MLLVPFATNFDLPEPGRNWTKRDESFPAGPCSGDFPSDSLMQMDGLKSADPPRAQVDPHLIVELSTIVLMPHGGCNCRCVMCDIWKANRERRELTEQDLIRHVESIGRLHPKWVTLSGGEALMSRNIWSLCRMLKGIDVAISLMSTGLLLRRHAENVVSWCDAVTVSLDGTEATHNAVRRVPQAFARLRDGVAALKALKPELFVAGRCVVQRGNFRELPAIVDAARELGLDAISFLPADVSSEGFNRPSPWEEDRVGEIALNLEETTELSRIVEAVIVRNAHDLATGFIHETASGLRKIPAYYRAVNGKAPFPAVRCNAPWVSAVIEADQSVRPCYFHPAIGNVRDRSLLEVLNSPEALAFRRSLDVATDPVCERCVCSLYLPHEGGPEPVAAVSDEPGGAPVPA